MSKKILFVATVQSHICQFHLPIMEMLKEEGFEVHVAARDNLVEKNGLVMKHTDKVYDVPFERSPFNKNNIIAYKVLKRIFEKENYDIVHCNTPVGGIVTRLLANRFRRKGLRVIYTAHGFHFYKGAPIKNWIIYYPIEKIMAYLTDDLITICNEDFGLAIRRKFKCNIYHINGLGVNTEKYKVISQEEKLILKKDKGYEKEFIILCIGELNKNKNQSTIIRAMVDVLRKYSNVKLLLAGNGPEKDNLQQLINQFYLEDNIKLIGYRTDLEDYIKISDLVVSASIREGLGLNILEAMTCGKPIIASNNRGHREVIKVRENGILVKPNNSNEFANEICDIIKNIEVQQKYSKKSIELAKSYSIDCIKKQLYKIYF